MISNEVMTRIQDSILLVLKQENIELFDTMIKYRGPVLYVQLLVDKHHGGITLEECASLNRKMDDLITNEGFLENKYTLEISSPGADRPLKTKKDFLRVMHYQARILLKEPIEERHELIGKITDVSDDSVMILFQGRTWLIPLGKIQKAEQYL